METHPSPSISLKNQFPNIPKSHSKMLDPPVHLRLNLSYTMYITRMTHCSTCLETLNNPNNIIYNDILS